MNRFLLHATIRNPRAWKTALTRKALLECSPFSKLGKNGNKPHRSIIMREILTNQIGNDFTVTKALIRSRYGGSISEREDISLIYKTYLSLSEYPPCSFHQRRVISPAFSIKYLNSLEPLFKSCTQVFTRKIYNTILEGERTGKPAVLDLYLMMQNLALVCFG